MAGFLKIINSKVFVSKSYLVNCGLNQQTLENNISRSKKSELNFYSFFQDKETKEKWIYYDSIPENVLKKIDLPLDSLRIKEILKNSEPNHEVCDNDVVKSLLFIFNQTWIDPSYWRTYVPLYKEFFFEKSVINQYARNHAVIKCIIDCRKGKDKFKMTDLFEAYKFLPKVIFKTISKSYFSTIIKKCTEGSIEEILVHNYRIYGRKPYRVTTVVKNMIQYYYMKEERITKSNIHRLVNTELITKELPKISRTTVSRICNEIEFRNKADILRYGKAYANNHILPYLTRGGVKNIGHLYQIDSTRISIPYKNDHNEVKYLTLCAVIDTFSRMIIGHSFGESENFSLIKSSLKSCLTNSGLIPRHILVDNHKLYKSLDFKILTNKFEEYGMNIRIAKVGNAKDKAHIESWFNKFQIQFLNGTPGFLGEGIKTKRLEGRVNQEVTQKNIRKKNLTNRNQLESFLTVLTPIKQE